MVIASRPSGAPVEVFSARNLPTTGAAGGRARAAVTLSAIALVAMAAASAAGLLLDGLYQDPESTASMLRKRSIHVAGRPCSCAPETSRRM